MLLDAVAGAEPAGEEWRSLCRARRLRPLLIESEPHTILPMILHSMNILRHWSELAWVVKAGIPCPRHTSIRGHEADRAAFIAAMHSISGPVADGLVAELGHLPFKHLLDVGGASGDMDCGVPPRHARHDGHDLRPARCIGQARRRLADSGFMGRVTLASGDFYIDELPKGADLVWLSAIVHQHSHRPHNRALLPKSIGRCSPADAWPFAISSWSPTASARSTAQMFAINMLVNTDTGGTFTFDEFAEDLKAAGFVEPTLLRRDEGPMAMNSVVTAKKA